MARNFAPITIESLKEKIDVALENGPADFIALLEDDIKVKFDLENFSCSAKDFGPHSLMGYHTEPNGLTYCGFCAGGDWEMPVYFLCYFDGKKLRGYVPTEGNPWNTTTKQAYGNDNEADGKDAKKREPDVYDGGPVEQDDFEYNPDLIRKDILERILPKSHPKTPSKLLIEVLHSSEDLKGLKDLLHGEIRQKKVAKKKIKSVENRIKALVFYGDQDECLELFQQTCNFCYKLNGFSMKSEAETVCGWAEAMAAQSLIDMNTDGEDWPKHKGYWG